MNTQKSHKFIVAGGMAGAIAIGIVAFALRSHTVAPVAQAAPPPPATLAPAPAAEAVPSTALADTTPEVAKVPKAPASIAQMDSAAARSAAAKSVVIAGPPTFEPKVARSRPLPKTED